MTENMNCPKCGKPMIENPKWRGQWSCPDYRKALNDAPPFEYKCTGMTITQSGADAFDEAVLKIQIARN